MGRCGTFSLDGRASSGGASRALSATWNVSASAGDTAVSTAVLAAVREALTPFQGSLLAELNASALEFGVEFAISFTCRSFLGGTGEAVATVTRRCDLFLARERLETSVARKDYPATDRGGTAVVEKFAETYLIEWWVGARSIILYAFGR